MNQKNLTDGESRLKIIGTELLDKNIFLSAGAGSGKTSSLVNRVIALIRNGIPISSIVAITFTREAAKMFYGRMTGELESMMEKTCDLDEKTRYQIAFEEIDSAFFGTIDSFCRKLLLEHPAEAGITSQLNPLENKRDKKSIVEKGLESLLSSKSPKSVYDHYQELGKWDFYGDEFTQILLYVLEEDIFDLELGEEPQEKRTPEIITYLEAVHGLGLLLKDEYEKRIIFGNSFEQSAAVATKGSVESYEKAIRFIDKEHPVNSLIFLENMVGAFGYKDRPDKAKKPDLLLERADELLQNMYFEQIKREYQELRYYKALSWAKEMRDALLLLGEEQGLISYNRSLKRLVQMLQRDKKNGAHLLSYLQEKYNYYFIDELQDTNQLQSQLFDLLAGDHPGALFIVGDEKQAIYRFRGGDVDNFKRIEEAMMQKKEGETVLQLTCNFRSSEPLRKWFNQKFIEEGFFDSDFPIIEEAEKQSLYEAYKDKVIDGVYTYPVIQSKKGTVKGPGIPTDEHMQVVEIIEKILGKPLSHYDHKTKTMGIHNLEYEDILLLTYGKKKLNEYMSIFKETGIPYSVVGSSNLQSSKALAMMGRALDYLAHPGDLYKEGLCLLGEPFSLSEKELYEYKKGKSAKAVQEVRDFLGELSEELDCKTPSAMYSHIMGKMKLIHLTSVYNVEEASDTLYYGLELVREAEREGKISNLEELGEFINEDLLIGDYEYELSLSGGSKGLRLMNLHKAKGLEGKVVILADAGEDKNRRSPEHQYDYENQSIKIFRIPKQGTGGFSIGDLIKTDKFLAEMEEEEVKLEEEARRLKYVAATRAENVLIIPTLYKNVGDSSQIPLTPIAGDVIEGRWSSLLTEDLRDILKQKMDFPDLAVAKSDTDKEIPDSPDQGDSFELPALDRRESYLTINPSKVQIRERDLENVQEVSAVDSAATIVSTDLINKIESPASRYPLNQTNLGLQELQGGSDSDNELQLSLEKWQREGSVVGTLVHALMEGLVLRLPEILTPEEGGVIIKNLIKLYEIPDEDKSFFSDTLWQVFNQMTRGGYPQDWAPEELRCPQDLLKELITAEEIYTELHFSISANKEGPLMKSLLENLDIEEDKDGYLNGIIDLLYKKDGEYIILDYKTNYSSEDLYKHYEGQIFLYKKVIKESFSLDKEPKAYLYHIPARDESSFPKKYR